MASNKEALATSPQRTEMKVLDLASTNSVQHPNPNPPNTGSLSERSGGSSRRRSQDSHAEHSRGATASDEHTRAWLDSQVNDLSLDAKNWLERHNEVSIVVTGKSGVGKSSFINVFLGNQGDLAAVADGLKPKTKEVKSYGCLIRNGVTLKLYDTPGFETKDHWDKSLKKIKEHFKSGSPDLVFFCVRMDELPQKNDYDAMTSLSNAFGPAIWMNTVIILTRGNVPPAAKFHNYISDMHECLQEHLIKGAAVFSFRSGPGVKKHDADNILQQYTLPAGDVPELVLPNAIRPWIYDVLLASLNRCSSTGAPALLRANWFVYKLHLKQTLIGRWLTKKKIKPYDDQVAAEPSLYRPLLMPQASNPTLSVQEDTD